MLSAERLNTKKKNLHRVSFGRVHLAAALRELALRDNRFGERLREVLSLRLLTIQARASRKTLIYGTI